MTNFLLGYGERLVTSVEMKRGRKPPKLPYSFAEARAQLAPQIRSTVARLDELPAGACPGDEAVAKLTLHPQFLAKSYSPESLLHALRLKVIGSRPATVKPKKWTRKGSPEPLPSTELFVAGKREAFRTWAAELPSWSPDVEAIRDNLAILEAIGPMQAADRLKPIKNSDGGAYLEVGLHTPAGAQGPSVLASFRSYAHDVGVDLFEKKLIRIGDLTFIPARGTKAAAAELARFSFLRVVRPMPKLRHLGSVLRLAVPMLNIELPDEDALDPSLRVLVLDGGTPRGSGLERWVTPYDAKGIGRALPEGEEHGAWVNSAALFGPLEDGRAPRPYAAIDHFRVLDADSGKDEDLYDVMHRIRDILSTHQHTFLNLSIGPEEAVGDEEVHPWTCMLDEHLSDGTRLATVAVGNKGEADATLGLNRVQVPSDGVNSLAVGAVDSRKETWARAPYSCVGPGRSPGLVKPDVVFFGGDRRTPFFVCKPGKPTRAEAKAGTSFASPSVLRLGVGIRAHFGEKLSPLAIRALLIHAAEDATRDRSQHGWGRVPEDVDQFIVCPDGSARVVFQGEIAPGDWLRAPIPLPNEDIPGFVTIRATFCYATRTDPNHPSNYTQSGLVVTFRPDDRVFDKDDSDHPAPEPFFQLRHYSTEQELRKDAHKWETVLHCEKRKRGAKLHDPAFDINYQARQDGAPVRHGEKMRYALVITVTAPRADDLYNRIVRRYQTKLRPLTPVLQIPVRSSAGGGT